MSYTKSRRMWLKISETLQRAFALINLLFFFSCFNQPDDTSVSLVLGFDGWLKTYLHIINTFAHCIHHEEGIVQILFGPPS